MGEVQGTHFDEQFSRDLSEAFVSWSEACEIVQRTDSFGRPDVKWEDFRRRIEEYLKKMGEFAKKNKAHQFNLQAGMDWPPRINITFTFKLNK